MDTLTQQEQLIIVIGILVAAFLYWNNRRPDKDGRLPDKAMTIDSVEKIILTNFHAKDNQPATKNTTEKTIQKQLFNFLEKKVLHVQEHKTLSNTVRKNIDFDLGRSRVGNEIKMGKSVFKAAERKRLVDQISDYNEADYGDDNLLLLIFCDEEAMKKRVFHKEVVDSLSEFSVKIHFLPITS